MNLYSCRTLSNGYRTTGHRIVKFDDDFNVEAVYEITDRGCSCPSWPRKSHCKHIDMLAAFQARSYVDTDWFHGANGGWYRPLSTPGEAEAWSTILGEPIDTVVNNVPIRSVDSIGSGSLSPQSPEPEAAGGVPDKPPAALPRRPVPKD